MDGWKDGKVSIWVEVSGWVMGGQVCGRQVDRLLVPIYSPAYLLASSDHTPILCHWVSLLTCVRSSWEKDR